MEYSNILVTVPPSYIPDSGNVPTNGSVDRVAYVLFQLLNEYPYTFSRQEYEFFTHMTLSNIRDDAPLIAIWDDFLDMADCANHSFSPISLAGVYTLMNKGLPHSIANQARDICHF